MRAKEFLRDKFDEHWKNGGSALNISAYAESKILIWMEEYKQLHQPTVIKNEVAVCSNPHCDNGIVDNFYGENIYCDLCCDKQTVL